MVLQEPSASERPPQQLAMARSRPLLGGASRATRPLAMGAMLALGAVAVVLMRSGEWHSTSLLAKGGAHGASDYISDTDATSDINNFFDKHPTLKEQVEQKLRALPAKEAPAKAKKSEVEALRSQFSEIISTPRKAAPAKKQVATGKLAAVDRALEKEEQKVEELKKQRAILESKSGKSKVMQQQLRWRTYPPGGGATSYAKTMSDDTKGSKECLPPNVMIDGKCSKKSYLTLTGEEKAAALKALRKNAYYKYKWFTHWHKRGEKHHYRVVPKRYPHASGADLGDNYVGLDCGQPDCRYKYLEDKMVNDDGTYPHARIPKLIRPFTGDGMDIRYPMRPQKLKQGIKIANDGTIDKMVGSFFKSQKIGYQRYMEQFHPWDKVDEHPVNADRFRPLASSLYRRKNYPKGGGASRGTGAWKTPTWSRAIGGMMPQLQGPLPADHKLPVVQGPKTDAEKLLIDGTNGAGNGFSGVFGDEQLPAESVLQGKANDFYGRKAEGEPMTDAGLNNWDMMNGVADP